MSDYQNWRTDVTAGEYFLHQRKQLDIADRRPVIRKPSDLVGPSIAPHALRVTNYSDPLATFNGFISSTRAVNGPRPEVAGPNAGYDINSYSGFVSSDAELGGVQRITDLLTGSEYVRTFRRAPADPGALTWSDWGVITPTPL